MTDLLDSVLLPVASEADAKNSATALAKQNYGIATVVHVIEKAGGAPDKAGVEQRERAAEEMFEAARGVLGDVETDILYGTDVVETIFEAAEDRNSSAVVFTPRAGNRLVQLLSGDVAHRLLSTNDRPVVVLPDSGDDTNAENTNE